MDSTKKPTRKRRREPVADILDKWVAATCESSCGSDVAGDVGSKKRRRYTVLPKGAKKGFMKGKGGPENLGCKYKGVRQRKNGKWVSEIRQPDGGPKLWLGTFDTADAAAAAFDRAALAMYGPRAQVNIPLEKEGSGDSSSPSVLTTTTPQLGNYSDATDHGCVVVDVVNNNNNNNDTNDALPAEFDDDPLAPIVALEQEGYCWINNIVFAGQESIDSSFIALNSGDSSSAVTTTTTPDYCFAPSSSIWAVSDTEYESNSLGPLEFDTLWQSALLWPESTLEDPLTEIAPPAQYDFSQSHGNWVGTTDNYELSSEDYAVELETNALGPLHLGTLLPNAWLQQELTLENTTTQNSGLQEGSSAPDDQNELNDWVDELMYTGDICFLSDSW